VVVETTLCLEQLSNEMLVVVVVAAAVAVD